MRKLKALAQLGRVSNLPTVWSNVLTGWVIGLYSTQQKIDWHTICSPEFWFLILGTSLIYWGGMALNDVVDVKWDRKHGKKRPITEGAISETSALMLTWFSLMAGAGIANEFGNSHGIWITNLITSIILYNWLHKKWAGSALLMGSCRIWLVVSAASAVSGAAGISILVWLYGVLLGLYVLGITLFARAEDGGDSRWGKVSKIFFLAPILYGFLYTISGKSFDSLNIAVYILISGLSLYWISSAFSSNKTNMGKVMGRLLSGIVLVDALVVSLFSPILAILVVLFIPILVLWQRYVSAS